VFETRFPLRTVEYSLRSDSGGPGRWRGGLGIRRIFEVTANDVTVSALTDRYKEGPFGLWKGQSGAPVGFYVRCAGESEFRTFSEVFGCVSPTKFINIRLHRGDQILIEGPGGGGYGNPTERSDEALRSDLRDRFVTRENLGAYGRSSEFV
jgi:N-methylhydantoinase B/oxoprolinase/acetone carboxylase alpha subunit